MRLSLIPETRPTAAARGAGVTFEGVSFAYRGRPVVHAVTGAIEPGSLLAVCGPNGAGKTTLLRGIAGLVRPAGGRIRVGQPDGQPLSRGQLAYLPQIAQIDRSFPISVADFVGFGLWRRTGLFARPRAPDRAAVARALAAVGIEPLAGRMIGELSGGQMQRASFARVLVQDAPLILLDEPLTALDHRTSEMLIGLIHAWHDQGRTVVAVIHDLALARAVFPQAMLLAQALIGWGPTEAVLAPANLALAEDLANGFTGALPAGADEAAPPGDFAATPFAA